MAPFDLSTLGNVAYALLFVAIGFGFGAVLEAAGFGDTRKLSAQFYLSDMTVLKTMFTAIVVAGLLVALASGAGVLDLSRVYVNPTYLWPGIVGGLIMGVGFVIGGFCPGTSIVAAATLKLDGIHFVAGVLTGVWVLGESVGSFESFWLSSYYGRFTLPEWLGLSTGATLLLVVAFALVAFALAEAIERRFAPAPAVALSPRRRVLRRGGAAALVLSAVVVAAVGQPSPEARFQASPKLRSALAEGAPLVHPAEVVALRKDVTVELETVDLRSEHDFNLFHLGGARRVEPAALESADALRRLRDRPASSVLFLVSNDGERALATWKRLVGLGVPNVYVVDGGVNRWLELYPAPGCAAQKVPTTGTESLGWRLAYATGASLPSSWPELPSSRAFRVPCEEPVSHAAASEHGITWPAYTYAKRVKLQTKAAVKGGCG
jgi:rhodanese-related sulfurtransferase